MKTSIFLFTFIVVLYLTIPSVTAQQHETVGGCLVIHLRAVNLPTPDIDPWCNSIPAWSMPNGESFDKGYAWVIPFLSSAFDGAERAHCGFAGCITSDKHVRLIVVADGMANAFVKPRPRVWISR